MFYFDNATIHNLTIHQSFLQEDQLEIISKTMQLDDKVTSTTLIHWLIGGFPKEEFYQMELSRVNPDYFKCVNQLLDDIEESNTPSSRPIIETLSKILAPEELLIITAHIKDILIDDELCNAVAVVVPEDVTPFLSSNWMDSKSPSLIDYGFPMDKIKYGVLILDTFRDSGARIAIKGSSAKSSIISVLKEEILCTKAIDDPFHYTKNYLTMCSKFVKERLHEDPLIAKTDQADILNKSLAFFKNEENFTEEKFLGEVFPEEQMSSAFKQYKNTYQAQHHIDLEDNFDISVSAVKKNQRVFKSVLKLDKNFHIYIHGDKNLIKKGAEPDGRKYYKIYFETEE